MSDKLPTREQALQLLIKNESPPNVISHCIAVSDLARETAETLKKKGFSINVKLVEIGALLHDIGRSKTHSVNHGVEGAKIVENAGLPRSVISIIKRHVGGGIPPDEAEALGWPKNDVYSPTTLEEKVVAFADELIDGTKRIPVESTIREFSKKGYLDAAERVCKLHDEIESLIRDCP